MKDPLSNSNQLPATNSIAPAANNTNLPSLTFNILAFDHPETTKMFTFSPLENTGKYRFKIHKLPEGSGHLFSTLDPAHPFVYTNFDTITRGINITIDFIRQPAIARAWYTLKIREYLEKYANVTVTNFLTDCQYWFIEKDMNTSPYDVYKKFTLRVQTDQESSRPELLVSYDGKAYILKNSLGELTGNGTFDTRLLKSVIYRKQLCRYEEISDRFKDAMYHKDEIFPVLNRQLENTLNINLPSVINRDKYVSVFNELEAFYQLYLCSGEFRKIIPHDAKWKPANASNTHRLADTSRNMVFGENRISTDVYNAFKDNGPFALPDYRHIKIFMIYREDDFEARNKLEEYIVKKSGFGSLGAFTRLPIEYDKSLDIVLSGERTPSEIINERLQAWNTDPSSGYFGFYISPYTRFETDPVNFEIYFKIKKSMLQRGIGLQVIERQKIFGNFGFSIANIGIAMVAKMGGIPWRLASNTEKDLIVGFGAFRSQKYNTKYVASALCFSNNGTFQEFNCFPADETWSIAGLVEEALVNYRKNNPEIQRLVIHFYQKIGRKQLKPIEEMLRRLQFDIPVIVVRINKTFSKSQLVFDETCRGKMPLNGSYVNLGRQEYLFCNNQRETAVSTPTALPLPLKIGLYCSKQGLLNDSWLVERLMRQVYEFSFMYWRSVKQQNLPVTITYPEMLAKLFPWFGNDSLDDEGRRNLFFL